MEIWHSDIWEKLKIPGWRRRKEDSGLLVQYLKPLYILQVFFLSMKQAWALQMDDSVKNLTGESINVEEFYI